MNVTRERCSEVAVFLATVMVELTKHENYFSLGLPLLELSYE
jgi:hypothetical protein